MASESKSFCAVAGTLEQSNAEAPPPTCCENLVQTFQQHPNWIETRSGCVKIDGSEIVGRRQGISIRIGSRLQKVCLSAFVLTRHFLSCRVFRSLLQPYRLPTMMVGRATICTTNARHRKPPYEGPLHLRIRRDERHCGDGWRLEVKCEPSCCVGSTESVLLECF